MDLLVLQGFKLTRSIRYNCHQRVFEALIEAGCNVVYRKILYLTFMAMVDRFVMLLQIKLREKESMGINVCAECDERCAIEV